MASRPLRQQQYQPDDNDCEHGGSYRAAHCETAFVQWLIEEIATVAPNGRVRMNAAQNRNTLETFVEK